MKINEDEISKFTKIADEWWDKNGPFKMLHEINPIRLNFILDNLNDEKLESINILDVGCGGGILCESLMLSLHANSKNLSSSRHTFHPEQVNAVSETQLSGIQYNKIDIIKDNITNEKNYNNSGSQALLFTSSEDDNICNITGIDPGFENIQIAKEHSKKSNLNINYIDTSLENFESETKFDIVISFEVIEHCENYKTFLKQLSHLLKPNGLLFLSTINRNFKSYLQAIIAAEYILKWIPKKTHEWKKFLKPSEINRILEKENIKIQKIKGMKFDLFSQSWCECDDINVNYMLFAQKK